MILPFGSFLALVEGPHRNDAEPVTESVVEGAERVYRFGTGMDVVGTLVSPCWPQLRPAPAHARDTSGAIRVEMQDAGRKHRRDGFFPVVATVSVIAAGRFWGLCV